jgi:anti-anti-sigma regulatory factor
MSTKSGSDTLGAPAALADFSYFLNIKRALVVVSWTGELRASDMKRVQGCINEITGSRAKFVIINLQGFTGYDSVLAHEIVRMQEKIRAMDAWLLFAGADERVKHKLAVNGLVKEDEMHESLRAALQFAMSTGLAA